MPLFFHETINATTQLAVWHITEPESFFLEKAFLQRNINHPHKRIQHLAARYLLQVLQPDFPYAEIQIAENNRPFFSDNRFHFSVSHCADYAAVIISTDKRVGIDVELPTEKILAVSSKFLHSEEQRFFSDGDLAKLTAAWCVKEAMFKWWGAGEVDFSEVLRINNFDLNEEAVSASFKKEALEIPLKVSVKQVEGLLVSWVVSDVDVFKMTS